WATPLYQEASAVDPSVQLLADALSKQAESNAQRVMLALQFVQQEVRYLGMEDGMGSHRPRKAADTLYRRYGDCKDKTALLLALLKAMGLAPTAALVSLEQGAQLPSELASPYAFDHVIVTLQLEGKRLWLDGTNLNQGNRLETVGFPYLRYALLVAPEVKSLTSMDSEFRTSDIQVRQELWVQKEFNRLQIESRYSGEQAEQQRSQWRNNSIESLGRTFTDYYSKIYSDADPVGLPMLRDDLGLNQLEMREVYQVAGGREALKQYGVEIYADLVDSYLKSFSDSRHQPLELTPPVRVEQEFVLHFPEPVSVTAYRGTEENAIYRFSLQVEPIDQSQLKVIYRYENLRDHVPVSELARYRESVRRTKEQLSLNFSVPNKTNAN
ncbi:MAG: transglutaminase domain-containing protein, partial [Aeromonadaceae bacterium]